MTNVAQRIRPDRDVREPAEPVTFQCSRRYLLTILAVQIATVAIVATAISEAGLPLAAIALTVLTPIPLGIFFAKLNYRFELTEMAVETVKPLSPRLLTITPVQNLREVKTRAGIFEMLCGVGTIVMTTLGGRLTWPHLSGHCKIADDIRDRVG
jgi:membrane protein YdbS with pleckstrin-like domain